MIGLLAKLFVEKKYAGHKAALRRAYGMLCSLVGIGLNICLFAGKYLAGQLSGSIAITADAFNNLSDAGSSLVTLVGFRFAGMKPDKTHPFGHGRIEYISGLAVAVAILLMGVELLRTSVGKIFRPEPVETGLLSGGILVVSILVKIYMAFYNQSVGKRIDSAAMKATAFDSLSDAAATFMVLLSMIVAAVTGVNVDGWCGALVAVFILYAGFCAARDTLNPLLGQAPDPEFIRRIYDITLAHKEILGIHDLVVHDYGPGRRMISLHGEVPGNMNIYRIHEIIDQTENELSSQLGCDAVIHMDPIDVNNERVSAARETVKELVWKIDPNLSIHDFRMVWGPTRLKMIFDTVVPYDFYMTDEEVKRRVEEAVTGKWKNCSTAVKIDHNMCE